MSVTLGATLTGLREKPRSAWRWARVGLRGHSLCQLAKYRHYTNNSDGLCFFQNQVFLEDRDCARRMLKHQAFAPAVPKWALEGCGFDAVATVFATVITSALPVTREESLQSVSPDGLAAINRLRARSCTQHDRAEWGIQSGAVLSRGEKQPHLAERHATGPYPRSR
jgi:hypothetical protein